jgi:hypothetical protein
LIGGGHRRFLAALGMTNLQAAAVVAIAEELFFSSSLDASSRLLNKRVIVLPD